jgi:hypothetical protein
MKMGYYFMRKQFGKPRTQLPPRSPKIEDKDVVARRAIFPTTA